MRRRALVVPFHLCAHATMGAVLGALVGAVLVGTDLVGLGALTAGEPIAPILIPAFACLFALAAGVTALALLGATDGDGTEGEQAVPRRLAAIRIRVRR